MIILILMILIILIWIFFQFISPLKFDTWVKSMFHKQNVNNLKRLLKECANYLNERGCNYQISYGTLLGIIREGDLISWDNDVDIIILSEDEEYFIKCMKMQFGKRFKVGSGLHRLFNGDNQYIDFYVYTNENNRLLPKNKFFKFLCRNFKGSKLGIVLHEYPKENIIPIQEIEWDNCKLKLPNRPIKVLEECYGKDWMIPQKW